jgi:hypothetical protein
MEYMGCPGTAKLDGGAIVGSTLVISQLSDSNTETAGQMVESFKVRQSVAPAPDVWISSISLVMTKSRPTKETSGRDSRGARFGSDVEDGGSSLLLKLRFLISKSQF